MASSGAGEQEAGRKQTWGENAADYHGLSDAGAAAACRSGNPMCCMEQAASRGKSSAVQAVGMLVACSVTS